MPTVRHKTDLLKWEMRDPALVIERKEQGARKRSCAGCKEIKVVVDPFGVRRLRCKLGNPVGQRCKFYQERSSE